MEPLIAHLRLHRFSITGGADRVRTDDLRLAKPALSRLSYSPRVPASFNGRQSTFCRLAVLWWVWRESNSRPHPYQGCALNLLSYRPENHTACVDVSPWTMLKLSLKEVIQPQVPLGLPCYDFTLVMNHTVVSALPEGLDYLLLVQPTPMV